MANSLAHLLIGFLFSIWFYACLFVIFMSTRICLCEFLCNTCIQGIRKTEECVSSPGTAIMVLEAPDVGAGN